MMGVVARALRGTRENTYLSVVSASVIAAALTLLGVFVLGILNLRTVLGAWEQDAHVSAYLAGDLAPADLEVLRTRLAARPEVKAVTYVSESDARAWLGQQVPEVGPSLKDFAPGTLPASMEITLHATSARPDQLEGFVTALRGLGPWTDIDYGQEWVARISTFVSLLTAMGSVLGGLIALATLFLVGNTVHLVVNARRDELEIMRLVGATDSYILGPFVVEGAAQGLIGAGVAVGGLWGVYKGIVLRLQDLLGPALGQGGLHFVPGAWVAGLVLGGVLLGALASAFAVRRFLGKLP
jgi:cell division transport system permease protein